MDASVVHEHTDVIVVGAGIAGGPAAIEARRAGAAVIGIERAASFGGTARGAGGGFCIAGSATQRAHGIVDAPSLALADLREHSQGFDVAWATRYFQRAEVDVHDWLVELGVEFVELLHQEEDSVPRWHQPLGAGRAVAERLWEASQRAGVADAWRFDVELIDLIEEGGRVVGIEVRDGGGVTRRLGAGAVVLATGGFAGNVAMVREHAPQLAALDRVLVGGGRFARGDGHRIVARHGGELCALQNVWCYAYATPDYESDEERGVVVRGVEAALWVNADGERFHDESSISGGTATPAVLRQPRARCWAIVDTAGLERLRITDPVARVDADDPTSGLGWLRASPHVHLGDDVEALAAGVRLPAPALRGTLAGWAQLVASGAERDPLTGRELAGVATADPDGPLCAIELVPMARKTLGGVRTDASCQVLRPDGTPIPGLYAAGELAGLAGGHLAGTRPLEGMMVGGGVFSGRIAGAAAAAAAAGQAAASVAPREASAQ